MASEDLSAPRIRLSEMTRDWVNRDLERLIAKKKGDVSLSPTEFYYQQYVLEEIRRALTGEGIPAADNSHAMLSNQKQDVASGEIITAIGGSSEFLQEVLTTFGVADGNQIVEQLDVSRNSMTPALMRPDGSYEVDPEIGGVRVKTKYSGIDILCGIGRGLFPRSTDQVADFVGKPVLMLGFCVQDDSLIKAGSRRPLVDGPIPDGVDETFANNGHYFRGISIR